MVSREANRDDAGLEGRVPARRARLISATPYVVNMGAKSFGERIADILIEDGLLLPNQLTEVMDLQRKSGGRLIRLLTDKGFVTEQDMVMALGRCLDTPPINLLRMRIPEDVMNLVPKELAKAHK